MRGALVHVVDPRPSRQPHRRSVLSPVAAGIALLLLLTGAAAIAPRTSPAAAGAGWDGWRVLGPSERGQSMRDAVPIGQEAGLPLYACRAVINGDVHIGRIRPDFTGCHIGFAGRETEIPTYETLAVTWRTGPEVGASAFPAGSERARMPEASFDETRLFVCRAAYHGGVHPGQARSDQTGCSFGYGGKQVVEQTYEVLQAAPWLTWHLATARNLPDTAVITGAEGGEPFYSCRATDRSGLHPGKIKKNGPGCSIASEGREKIADRFEVLTTRWQAGRNGTVPVAAYPAGSEAGNLQFVCRAQTRDSVQVGKMNGALGGCHVGMLGREVVLPDYEVLSQ